MLTSWANCNSNPTILSYGNEILWNNSNIRTGGCTIIYKIWYQKGIKYFKDIYDDITKTIHLYDRLKDLYHLPDTDFLKYLALIQSIPKRWKTNIKHENTNIPMALTTINQVIKANQTNKFVYHFLMEKKTPIIYFGSVYIYNSSEQNYRTF